MSSLVSSKVVLPKICNISKQHTAICFYAQQFVSFFIGKPMEKCNNEVAISSNAVHTGLGVCVFFCL